MTRAEITELMSIELVRTGAFNCEADAMRTLRAAGFKAGDIVVCCDDARQAAQQHIVAREMSAP